MTAEVAFTSLLDLLLAFCLSVTWDQRAARTGWKRCKAPWSKDASDCVHRAECTTSVQRSKAQDGNELAAAKEVLVCCLLVCSPRVAGKLLVVATLVLNEVRKKGSGRWFETYFDS